MKNLVISLFARPRGALFTKLPPILCANFFPTRTSPLYRQYSISSRRLGLSNSAALTKFSRKTREKLLVKVSGKVMADPINADVLAPLQAAVKQQVGLYECDFLYN